MLSRKFKAYLDLARPVNVAITCSQFPLLRFWQAQRQANGLEIVIAALTGGFVAAAANSINDFFDVEIDRTNKPSRPIPRGDATKREAWIEWLVLSIAAIALNFFLNRLRPRNRPVRRRYSLLVQRAFQTDNRYRQSRRRTDDGNGIHLWRSRRRESQQSGHARNLCIPYQCRSRSYQRH